MARRLRSVLVVLVALLAPVAVRPAAAQETPRPDADQDATPDTTTEEFNPPAAPEDFVGPPEPDARALAAIAPEQARLSGRIAWLRVRGADLLGSLSADVPWLVRARRELFLSVGTDALIQKSDGSHLRVLEFDYDLETGYRAPVRRRLRWVALVGQAGKELLDRDGSNAIRFAVVGLESSGWRRHVGVRPWEWQAQVGWIPRARNVDARGIVRLGLRYGIASAFRPTLGLEFRETRLFGGDDTGDDFEAGPWFDLGWGGFREAELFVHWARRRTPIAPVFEGWTFGLHLARTGARTAFMPGSAYRESEDSELPSYDDPGAHGIFLPGRGWGRRGARFGLLFSSPALPLGFGARAIIDTTVDVLTARETTDLFYRLEGGLQWPCLDWPCGVYLFHRSNHQLATFGEHVRSDNVLSLGVETRGWARPLELIGEDPGNRFEAKLRAGYVMQTSFAPRRWHVEAGGRVDMPNLAPSLIPFVQAEWTGGDVNRRVLAVGVRSGSGVELRLEHTKDDQLFANSKNATLLMLGGRF